MPICPTRSAALLAVIALAACAARDTSGDYPKLLPIDAVLAEAGVDPLPPAGPPEGFAAP